MITAVLAILVIGLTILAGLTITAAKHANEMNDSLKNELEDLKRTNESSAATRQLLRNEITVLRSQIQSMEAKSPAKSGTKKKRSTPKMNAKEQK